MSGRGQALTRTRCPACGTVFRVTSEQLRLKAGKVRCGQCQMVFNAFDHLQTEAPRLADQITPVPEPEFVEPKQPEIPLAVPEMPDTPPALAAGTQAADDVQSAGGDSLELLPEPEPEPIPESPEQTTQAAREAGLVAVRELADSNAAYNRWSAGALAGDSFGGFDEASQKSPLWPYVLVFLLLLMVLLAQLSWHFRTEIVLRMPATAVAYAALGVDVPLPREAALVSIETSDLQADKARGLFVLNATLKNRAAHDQAWPSLELTLTDINDRVVARRVIESVDYLQSGAPKEHFPANGETGVRLWIEASNIGATGYRLYIFYP